MRPGSPAAGPAPGHLSGLPLDLPLGLEIRANSGPGPCWGPLRNYRALGLTPGLAPGRACTLCPFFEDRPLRSEIPDREEAADLPGAGVEAQAPCPPSPTCHPCPRPLGLEGFSFPHGPQCFW